MDFENLPPENPVMIAPKEISSKEVNNTKETNSKSKTTTKQPKKKAITKKRPAQRVQPSIAAHIQPYNIVADLQ